MSLTVILVKAFYNILTQSNSNLMLNKNIYTLLLTVFLHFTVQYLNL